VGVAFCCVIQSRLKWNNGSSMCMCGVVCELAMNVECGGKSLSSLVSRSEVVVVELEENLYLYS
jgi:hypothetical protein